MNNICLQLTIDRIKTGVLKSSVVTNKKVRIISLFISIHIRYVRNTKDGLIVSFHSLCHFIHPMGVH